jgi:D-alanyl-D-alanine carboxypeptidase
VTVVDANSGKVICSSNADKKTQPASLTKMMTLFLIFKALQKGKISRNTMISISPNAAAQSPSVLGLKVGDQISVINAILALIVRSANDIAVALAEHIGKNEKLFVAMMNKEAKRLGMKSTIFYNPSGWKDHRQLTTANDMAKLARALLNEYPGYYHLFSNKQFNIGDKCIKGHYALLGKKGDIVIDGIKTGFVNASGFNLVASAVKGKRRLIAVVLGCKNVKERDLRAYFLLKNGFEKIANAPLFLNIPRVSQKKPDKLPKIISVLNDNLQTPQTPPPAVLGIYNKINKATFEKKI